MKRTSTEIPSLDAQKKELIESDPRLTRRQALQSMLLGGIALAAAPVETLAAGMPTPSVPYLNDILGVGGDLRYQSTYRRGVVVEAKSKSVYPYNTYSANPARALQQLDAVAMRLTGRTNPRDAWSSFVGPGDKVGVLLDARGSRQSRVQGATIKALIACLQRSGVRPNDIILWTTNATELSALGLRLNWSNRGVRIVGANQLGYDSRYTYKVPGMFKPFVLSKIVTQHCNVLINLASLEDHPVLGCRLCLAQEVTQAFSNGMLFERFWGGARGLGILSLRPILKNKFVLHLIDGLAGQYNGNLGKWRPGVIIGGTDPVAVDRVGFAWIDTYRTQRGLTSITNSRRSPLYLNQAANNGLGVANLSQIKRIRLTLP